MSYSEQQLEVLRGWVRQLFDELRDEGFDHFRSRLNKRTGILTLLIGHPELEGSALRGYRYEVFADGLIALTPERRQEMLEDQIKQVAFRHSRVRETIGQDPAGLERAKS